MSAILIVSVLLLILVALAITNRKRNSPYKYLPESPAQVPQSLFDPPSAATVAALEAEQKRQAFLDRAHQSDLSVLAEARKNKSLYHELLSILLRQTDVQDLAVYLTHQAELRSNAAVAQALIARWKQSPTRSELAPMLHVAALSDCPDSYWLAAETAIHAWHDGQLPAVSWRELAAIIEAEYWLMEPTARESAVMLKRFVRGVRSALKTNAGP